MAERSWGSVLRVLGIVLLALPVAAAKLSAPEASDVRIVPATHEAESGQPVEWILEVLHPRRARPEIVSDPLAERLGPSWVYLAGPEVRTLESNPSASEVRSQFVWRLMALEAGEQSLPEVVLRGKDGQDIQVASAVLAVRTALADGEDQARPMAEFHDVEGGPLGSLNRLVGLLIGLLGLVLLALGVWIASRRRRRRGAPAVAAPQPREVFDELVAARADDRDGVRRLAFGLTGVLRAAFPAGDPGATDGEWVGALRESGSIRPDRFASLEALVASCEGIKYGATLPTRFAVDELIASARGLLEGGASGAAAQGPKAGSESTDLETVA